MKRLSKKLLYTLGVTLICGGMQLHAQSLDQAKKLYNDGKYAEAKPVFEKLVKQAPSNASYNQWYGVCCFETGDLAGAEKHLKVAVKRNIAFVPADRDNSVPHSLTDRTAVLAEMRAFCVPAFPDEAFKFREGVRQLFLVKKVESDKIKQAEAGGIGDISVPAAGKVGEGIKLHSTGSMLPSCYLRADLAGFQVKLREKRCHER